jgi:hypothetical protein
MFLLFTIVSVLVVFFRLKPSTEVLYIDEDSGTGLQLSVIKTTPKRLFCQSLYRFYRYSKAYNFRTGMKLTTRYFAKRGTAYTKMLKNGSLEKVKMWDVVQTILPPKTIETLSIDDRSKLMNSTILCTIDLETGYTPTGSALISEFEAKKEANEEFAGMVGKGINKEINKQDIMKVFLGLGAGMAIAYVLHMMGIVRMN